MGDDASTHGTECEQSDSDRAEDGTEQDDYPDAVLEDAVLEAGVPERDKLADDPELED